MHKENYTADGETVQKMREESRRKLAISLLRTFTSILLSTIAIASILIWYGKLSFDNSMTLILASSSTFSGLLGAAITFYFSSDNGS